MRVSIVIPSYNQGMFIEETLQSVFNQTYPTYELIVMDGGSTDNTVDILKKYDEQIDYWSSENDNGQTDALIKGFKRSTGDILCWLCSDDLLEPNALEKVVNFFTSTPYESVVSGNATWIDIQGNTLKKNRDIPFIKWIWLYTYNYIIQPSTFWRRDIYEKVGGLDRNKNLTMDADLWIRFSEHVKIKKTDSYLSRLRLYPDQKNVRLRNESNCEDIAIRNIYGVDRNSVLSRLIITPIAYSCRIILKFFYGSYFTEYFNKNTSKFRVSSK